MSGALPITCDIAVVGGGPAGIAAATRAAEQGRLVVIIDSGIAPGGQIWRHSDSSAPPRIARHWLSRLGATSARWMLQTTVVDADISRGLTVVGPAGTVRVRAPRLIIATGARELFLPFPGWTLPNVMGVGGAQAMLKSGMDVRNKRVVIAGSGPLLLPVAAAMAKAGAHVVSVAEQASAMRLGTFALSLWLKPATLVTAARYRAAFPLQAYRSHSWVERAEGAGRVERVTLRAGSRMWTEPCDLLCCGYGLVPAVDLARLMGCRVEDGCVIVDETQATTLPGVFSAGETTGIAGEAAAIAEGEIAGLAAASSASSISRALRRHRADGRAFVRRLRETFRLDPALRTLATPETIICRCEDVRRDDFDPSWSGRQAKLYTRAGMGPCQGAVCGPALERIFGWSAGTVRPPLLAPALGAWMADPVDPGANV